MKKPLLLVLTIFTISTLIGCSVADDVKDTFDAVECAAQIERLDQKIDDNSPCSEIKSEIDKLLSGSCREFITSEQRTQFEFIRDNCTDD